MALNWTRVSTRPLLTDLTTRILCTAGPALQIIRPSCGTQPRVSSPLKAGRELFQGLSVVDTVISTGRFDSVLSTQWIGRSGRLGRSSPLPLPSKWKEKSIPLCRKAMVHWNWTLPSYIREPHTFDLTPEWILFSRSTYYDTRCCWRKR